MLKLKSTYLPGLLQIEEHLLGQDANQTSWLIGRNPSCDLRLNDHTVTRIHGRIQRIEGQFYFSDMGSRNGSIVNDRKLGRDELYCLKPEDKIQMGKALLYVVDVGTACSNREIA